MPEADPSEVAARRLAWRKSTKYRRAYIIYWMAIILGAIAAVFIAVSLSTSASLNLTTQQWAALGIGLLYYLIISLSGWSYFKSQRSIFYDEYLLQRTEELSRKSAELIAEKDLKLGELWRLTADRLNLYHEIATRQARNSFRNAQWAIAGGFIVIIGGAIGAFFGSNTTITVVVGALATAGTALSAYIARTFLRLQENAATYLRSYFDQPQEQFRYLAAERLLDQIKNRRQRTKAIDQLIAGIISSTGSEKPTGR